MSFVRGRSFRGKKTEMNVASEVPYGKKGQTEEGKKREG
ncbi:MAG: hypothetical protein ACJA02_000896 [Myxococcota bacterium]|jgi:hypothetical protein